MGRRRITGGRQAGDGGGILNTGTLTLEGGSVSGNLSAGNGGGIFNSGTVKILAGTLSGNTAGESGGGLFIEASGTATVSGGLISGNTAGGYHGGGIYNRGVLNMDGGRVTGNEAKAGLPGGGQGGGILQNGIMNVSGAPYVGANIGVKGSNLYLRPGKVLTVAGALTGDAFFRVYHENGEGAVTGGFTGSTSGCFQADSRYYYIAFGDDGGQVWLKKGDAGRTYVRRGWDGARVTEAGELVAEKNPKPFPSDTSVAGGWYILDRDVTVNGRISFKGNTDLILGDGYTLDVKGLFIPWGKTLTIYGQPGGTGKIYSHPTGGGAAIGGKSGENSGSVVIHGGVIEAYGDTNCAGIGTNDDMNGGEIVIYGGTVTAKGGGNGAGIGGGRDCDGGKITIYGGTITANSGSDGACIGGGNNGDGGTITIHGGTISASSRDGACIGGGDDGDGGKITINGGSITADYKSGSNGEGTRIGGGSHSGAGGTITINGGEIKANGKWGAGIGGGRAVGYGSPDSGNAGTITINGGTVHAHSERAFGIGAGGQTSQRTKFRNFPNYALIGSGGNVTITGGTVDVWGYEAGIGGDGGTINIRGGKVTATGSEEGDRGSGLLLISENSHINISGGEVTVVGYDCFSGISADNSTVTITGGTVDASAVKGSGIGENSEIIKYKGRVLISGFKTVVRGRSDKSFGVNFNSNCSLGPGVTIETWSFMGNGKNTRDKDNPKFFYEGCRIRGGQSKETAEDFLWADDRETAHKNEDYKYILVEPCPHDNNWDQNQTCGFCGYVRTADVHYIRRMWDGEKVTSTRETVPTEENLKPFPENGTSIPAGWYFVSKDITIKGRVSLQGDTNLILSDGYKLDVKGLYVPEGKTLTIYGQAVDSGVLYSHPSGGAAIGAYEGHRGGDIVIHGGTIRAVGTTTAPASEATTATAAQPASRCMAVRSRRPAAATARASAAAGNATPAPSRSTAAR